MTSPVYRTCPEVVILMLEYAHDVCRYLLPLVDSAEANIIFKFATVRGERYCIVSYSRWRGGGGD